MTTSNLIFQVLDDVETVLITRSESKAYQIASRGKDPWIIVSVLDSIPCNERVYDDLDKFVEVYI